jgi:plastocyanin
MNRYLILAMLSLMLAFASCAVTQRDRAEEKAPDSPMEPSFLPEGENAKVLSIGQGIPASAGVIVQTQAVAVQETGPKETVARFGEVYAFSPAFLAIHRDEPTEIDFWNLQADDEHDFMLADSDLNILMKIHLPALQETSYVFTFHREGLFHFYCTMHQPEMSGQILVLPAKP